MIHITIITLGKFKESYWRDAEAEYLKRLTPYAKINIIELKEVSFSERDKVESIRKKETEILEKNIPKNSTLIAMHESGKSYDSPHFAEFISSITTHGEHLTFVFGGPLGLDRDFLAKCHYTLSLSLLTLPHQLARIVFVEQIYRAMTIVTGKVYHY